MKVWAGTERWASRLVCSRTGEPAPLDEPAFLSPAGAPYLVEYELHARRGEALAERLPQRPWTLWRYAELLPVRDLDRRVDLGEGCTPLLRIRRLPGVEVPDGLSLWLKDESGNPTGSFKARGLSLAVTRACELGAPGVQLPSAGNAAVALSTYARAAGLPCRVALPADTPPGIRRRCEAMGTEVLLGGASLVDAAALLSPGADGYWDLSTLREPYRVEGKKTMGLELWEQLDGALPDWIVYPTGGGTGIIGMHKAFLELDRLGLVSGRLPRFVVVQMRGCAPLVRAHERGEERAEPWAEPHTKVWGLRVPRAIGDFLVLRALRESDGLAIAVEESAADSMRIRLAAETGVLSGPEGAAAVTAAAELIHREVFAPGEQVVVFQTGHPANYE